VLCASHSEIYMSGDETAAEKFAKINRAHEVLTDEVKRQIYD